MKLVLALLALLVALVLAATPADASPITWSFVGTVDSSGTIAEIPGGTVARFDWTFDPATPNSCGSSVKTGFYPHQTATLQLATTIGLLTYQAAGFLIANGAAFDACGATRPDMELRFPSWSGPDLPNAILNPAPGSFDASFPGLFWSDPSLNGAFPTSPPASATFFSGDLFLGEEGRAVGFAGEVHAVQPVPEPASLVLLGTGLALARFARSRRRGRGSIDDRPND